MAADVTDRGDKCGVNGGLSLHRSHLSARAAQLMTCGSHLGLKNSRRRSPTPASSAAFPAIDPAGVYPRDRNQARIYVFLYTLPSYAG